VWVCLISKCFEIRTAAGRFFMKFDIDSLGQLCAPAALSLRKKPQYLLYNMRLVGSQSRYGYTEEKIT